MDLTKSTKIIISLSLIAGAAIVFVYVQQTQTNPNIEVVVNNSSESDNNITHPMAIENLRQREYPGGEFTIEEELPGGLNHSQYIASYLSEGLKIYGLLTIPDSPMPEGGYPAVVFVHGYIPPNEYSTTGSYPTYPLYLARNGFIVFKPDLRGHGRSEGEPVSAHYSEKYVIDTLYSINYLKNHELVNPNRIGYWGHSNGGQIGLRTALIDPTIKAASLWAGVVGSYEAMFETYANNMDFIDTENPLTREYGIPSEGGEFWRAVEPYEYLGDIEIPIELQHGTEDKSVPVELSVELKDALESREKDVVYHEYEGDDHNISMNVNTAWQRSISFFKENL
ncbi:MAG: alpha/beta fold hydrolase [Candidatus Spechtbacterales bacterium]|nr:alpha/beta fold hydrolase [Candidatus Spechtbacterales bacterium]